MMKYRKLTVKCYLKSRSRQRIFRCRLHCQINMNLVFHISEDGSEIELKHCASSKTSVKWSRKYFVHLNWIRLATNPSWLDSSIGRAAVLKPEDASSNPARDEFFASSKTSVKLSRKYFLHLNWIRLATNPSWLDSSIGRAAV